VPVISAVRGLALGGGCELAVYSSRRVVAMESYIGLVEVGVGITTIMEEVDVVDITTIIMEVEEDTIKIMKLKILKIRIKELEYYGNYLKVVEKDLVEEKVNTKIINTKIINTKIINIYI
jgi:hypothetical protein